MPADRRVAARSSRVWVVVLVMSRKGTPCCRTHSTVSIAPGSGRHDTVSTPSMSRRRPSIPPIGRSLSTPVGHPLGANAHASARFHQSGGYRPAPPPQAPLLVRGDETVAGRKGRPESPDRPEGPPGRKLRGWCEPDPVQLAKRIRQRREGESRDTLQHGPPLGVARRVVEEGRDLPGGLGDPELARGDDTVDV